MLNACAINKVILMGRITRDPDMRQTQNGSVVCRFSIAIDRPTSSANAQNGERQSDFINIVAFDKNAEFVSRYLSKGRLVLIEGNLRTGSYEDRNHPDVKHYTTDVVVERISFGETKSSSQGGGYQQGGYQQGGYQQGGYAPQQSAPQYGGQGGYQQPYQPQTAPPASVNDLSDFEEVISESDLPF